MNSQSARIQPKKVLAPKKSIFRARVPPHNIFWVTQPCRGVSSPMRWLSYATFGTFFLFSDQKLQQFSREDFWCIQSSTFPWICKQFRLYFSDGLNIFWIQNSWQEYLWIGRMKSSYVRSKLLKIIIRIVVFWLNQICVNVMLYFLLDVTIFIVELTLHEGVQIKKRSDSTC